SSRREIPSAAGRVDSPASGPRPPPRSAAILGWRRRRFRSSGRRGGRRRMVIVLLARRVLARDLHREFFELDEYIGLAAQFVGDHRRLRLDRAYYRDADAAALHRFHQPAEIAVAGEQ